MEMTFVAVGWQVYDISRRPLDPERDLGQAFAMNTTMWQVSIIIGPAFGGLLYAIRPELVYGVAATLSAASCLAILTLRSGRQGAGATSPDLQSVLAGVRLVRRTPVLLGAISLDLFAVLFGGAVALLPVYARDILDVGPFGLGVLRAAPAVGGVLVAVYLHFRPVRERAGPTLLVVVAIFGASMIVFGVSESMALSLVALAIGGGADLVSMVLRQQILPLVTPDDLRGRVNS